ncbi:hypothetical protein F52700_1788 [Fusarium sp. NRRL 52700]|nr:hypothetical protein F52700_1788 [Fusarium sp. NRRL 52700]
MQSPKNRLSLWTLLLSLSSGALSAPESCDEMGDIYTASAYSYTTECDTSLNNPIIYSSYYEGDTFAQCIDRCDTDEVCSAILYEDPTGSCYLAADFTSTSPSNGYSVAVKGAAVSEPEPTTTNTEVLIASTTEVSTTVASTTEVTSEASTTEVTSQALTTEASSIASTSEGSLLASTSEVTSLGSTTEASSVASTSEVTTAASTTEVTSESSTTAVSSVVTTSEVTSVASSTEGTSAASSTEVFTIGSTSETSSVASTSDVSSITTTSEVTSLASTTEVSSSASTSDDCDETETSTEIPSTLRTSSSPLSESTSDAGVTTTRSFYISTTPVAATSSQTSITSDKSTAETSSVSTLATVITSQGTESILSTSSEITTSTEIQSSPATTFETTQLSTLTTLTRPVSLSTTETQAITTTAKSGATTSHGTSQTVSSSSASTYVYVNPGSETLSASGSTMKAPYPIGYTIRTVYQTLTNGATCTKTTFAETVTTATYVTVGPSHSALVTTCVPVTLLYSPCYCDHQAYPTLSMTTLVSPCSACGTNGENTVTLTVPEAACETTSGSYSHPIVQYPSGWTGGYQTAQNGTDNHEAQYTVKSHGQPQGSPQHTYTNVEPSVPAPTAGAYSHTQLGYNGQPSASISTAGLQSSSQKSKDSYQNESHSTQGEAAHPTGPREAEAPVVAVVAGMVPEWALEFTEQNRRREPISGVHIALFDDATLISARWAHVLSSEASKQTYGTYLEHVARYPTSVRRMLVLPDSALQTIKIDFIGSHHSEELEVIPKRALFNGQFVSDADLLAAWAAPLCCGILP